MTEDEGVFPVVYLRNFFFCEQIPYINIVLHVFEPETESMIYGRERHLRFHAQHLPKTIRAERVETDVRLASLRLGLSGVLDALVHAAFGELVPCELKHSGLVRGRPALKDVVQLTAYAMLVEDVYRRTVKGGVLYYDEDKSKHVVNFSEGCRRLVWRGVRALREMAELERMPRGRSLDKCGGCWYSRVCWGRPAHPRHKYK
ncbi:MAG: CRISPR-associated protein Cas4 [Candidatus Caldarchaeum sp.]|nr:CRISPR-associated protein Cas4 [Candidatus Caldarchaeum sp.]